MALRLLQRLSTMFEIEDLDETRAPLLDHLIDSALRNWRNQPCLIG